MSAATLIGSLTPEPEAAAALKRALSTLREAKTKNHRLRRRVSGLLVAIIAGAAL